MAIDWKHIVVHRLLNLPERAPSGDADEPPEQADPTPASNPWLTAGRAAAPVTPRGSEASSEGTRVQTATGATFTIKEQSRSALLGQRVLRVLLVLVLMFFAWVGVRTAFFTDEESTMAPNLPAEATFDDSSAEGVATRLAISALTWDEDEPAAHREAVSLDYAGGASDLGWNGEGRQEVVRAIPNGVAVSGNGSSAVVTVLAQVETYTRQDDGGDGNEPAPWEARGRQWITVEVPVSTVNGRMVATAGPSPVGQATPAEPSDEESTRTEDPNLTDSTREHAEAFFAAYGEGDVEAVEAPGANIVAPATTWRFETLDEWTVYAGRDDERRATATVTWALEGQAQQYTASYSVTLTTVSGSGVARWQVQDITVG